MVVSPETAVQTSLRFMLEAEGYSVRAFERLSDAATADGDYDCAIIDHKLIGRSLTRLGELADLSRPIILLVDQMKDFPAPDAIQVVEKPLLGKAVIEAVDNALSRR